MAQYRMDKEGNLHPVEEVAEVSKMNDQQLNRALAELMGYKIGTHTGENGRILYFLITPGGRKHMYNGSADEAFAWDAPRYCTDHAASIDVQTAALENNEMGYMAHLTYRTGHDYHVGLTHETAASMLRATPRQRAEAAYMTLREASS